MNEATECCSGVAIIAGILAGSRNIELKGMDMAQYANRHRFLLRFGFTAMLLGFAAMPIPGADVPGFPGAEGFGATASGGRAGRVIAVTNLNDSGPGSLRAAVDEKGPRTIVFRVSGNIPLKSSIKLRNGDLTLAGQTAPGDGICLQNYSLDLAGANNVIVRYLRVRPGDSSGKSIDALGGREGENIIIDHCSVSWSIDESVSIYGGARNVTVQWCLISESLYQSVHTKGHHGFGGIWGGQNASWHHNLLAHHFSRNPRIPGKNEDQFIDLRNNVIYNWAYNSCYGGDGDVRVNLINNYYKPGPATREGVRARLANPSPGEAPNNWWIAGNFVVGSPKVTGDNWLGVQPSGERAAADYRADKPFEVAPVTTQPAEQAFEMVSKQAGAILPRRDSVDARIIEEARTGIARFGETYEGGGKGIIDSQKTVGGWPELRSTAAPVDSDGDGMPDEWENKFGFDSKTASDNSQDKDKDGYTNLEEYLNGTDPTVFVDYTKSEINVNTPH
jgi:pectate lyase